MIHFLIPPATTIEISHLVLDFNGTLALDGRLLPGVAGRLRRLQDQVELHVVTADTFGLARNELSGFRLELTVLPPENQMIRKADYVRALGSHNTAAVGNGNNDAAMLEEAVLGICVVQSEGAAVSSVMAADVVCMSALDALDLLLVPKRLTATLRS